MSERQCEKLCLTETQDNYDSDSFELETDKSLSEDSVAAFAATDEVLPKHVPHSSRSQNESIDLCLVKPQ